MCDVFVVVIVDDDEVVCDGFVLLLCMVGVLMCCYLDVLVFFVDVDDVVFGCVLFDIWMLGMSGFDVFDELCVWCDLLVIVMMGYGNVDVCWCVFKCGVFDFLCKLVDDDELIDMV